MSTVTTTPAKTTTKKVKEPKKTSERKRPNRQYIERMTEFRGFMTGNEKTSLTTLKVKNAMQRINNIAMSDDTTKQFSSKQNSELQLLMKNFIKKIDTILKKG